MRMKAEDLEIEELEYELRIRDEELGETQEDMVKDLNTWLKLEFDGMGKVDRKVQEKDIGKLCKDALAVLDKLEGVYSTKSFSRLKHWEDRLGRADVNREERQQISAVLRRLRSIRRELGPKEERVDEDGGMKEVMSGVDGKVEEVEKVREKLVNVQLEMVNEKFKEDVGGTGGMKERRWRAVPITEWKIKFSGGDKGLSANQFLTQVKRMAMTQGISDAELLSSIWRILEGGVENWFWACQDQFKDWESFTEMFVAEFQDEEYYERLREQIRQRKQKPGEKFAIFRAEMELMMKELVPPMSQHERFRTIYRNLSPMYLRAMGGQVIYSLEELTVFCKRIEQTEKMCEGYEKSVTKKVDKVAVVGVENAKKGCGEKMEVKKEKKIERKVDEGKTVEKKKDSFSCANCFGSGHGVLRCPEKRRARFLCYQCGAADVTTKTCKSCNKGGGVRQGGSKTSSEEGGETQVCVVYAESRQGDNRMFVDVDVNGVVVKGMLDSGATTSVLGRGWREIVNKAKLKVRNSEVRGRSATGMRMRGGLEVDVPVAFNGRSQILTIPIFPEVTEDLLLGMDFWREFGLSPALPFIHEQSVASIDVEAWLSQEQKRMIEECVKLFPVTSEGNFGCTPLVSHSIDTGDAKPTVQRCYPVSPHVLKAADQELHRMEKLGVIKKCAKSPWRSAMTVTTKSNGKIRLCLDARALNKVTVKDTYPMPHLENILSNLGGTKYLSAIDLSDAYWQVPLDEEAQAKTAFALIGRPLFMFARMPFGLVGAPATMARLADAVIGPELAPHVWTYLDDIIVATDDFESHVKYLKIVAERLKMAKLTINRDKSKFCVPELRYLGFVVNEEGIKIEPDKIEAIQNYPKPSTVKEVRQLLGMCGWNRRFIKDYAKIMAPISNLLKGKPNRIVWTSEAERAFEEIKRALGSAPILRNPKYDRVFHVCTDASDVGIGAQLTQRDDNGDEYTVTYISQKLSETQKKWSIGERECLSVIVALNKWRHYLEGSKVVVVTDSEALKWLLKQGDAKGRIGRWALQIQQFDFSVVHRSGCNNIIPDALSRNISELAEEAVDPEGHEVCAVDKAEEEVNVGTGDEWYDELVNKIMELSL
ncbi:uncharacterized protein LOC129789226 [Lutzomyia longipalpis]|uniref:uncharacterized protein LOC129789226 n=1 Tax=Lutzomyia longipalpis TaxID=7200 RepID=UPI002483C851|nr:uncharacterized protein LOC129789226 [Lutzomyia longipalpis]